MNVLLFIIYFTVISILITITYDNYVSRKRAKDMNKICKAARKLNEQYRQGKVKM